jgi:hypothetical protein
VQMYRSRLKNQCAGCRVAGQTIAVSLRRRDIAPLWTTRAAPPDDTNATRRMGSGLMSQLCNRSDTRER